MTKSPIIEKSPLMEQYEQETGKLAIWKGEVSKNFKKWKKKKKKEEIKQQKLKVLTKSKIEKKKIKKEIKDDKVAGKDYEHLSSTRNSKTQSHNESINSITL